jgi:hypothetical protein
MLSGAIFAFIWIVLGIILLIFAYGIFSIPRKHKRNPTKKTHANGRSGSATCPLCGSPLIDGAQLKSTLYPGKQDRICHIFGCPHCYPYNATEIDRKCPVCRKPVPQEGYLIARFFDRANGKKHVHIVGCTECRISSKTDSYRGK